LAEIKAQYNVNPTEDWRPVCQNYHAMIHKNNPPFSIEELEKIMQQNT
jgi:5-methylcytosine-specific restriction protein A